MESTTAKFENVCQHGFWIGQGAAPCPFCHPECYKDGTQGVIAPLITVNLNTLLDSTKDARIAALESALAAAREENTNLRIELDAMCENFDAASKFADEKKRELAALRDDPGRVERVARLMQTHFGIETWGELSDASHDSWKHLATDILDAADRRTQK